MLDALYYGEKHPTIGNIVCAKILLSELEDDNTIIIDNIKKHCKDRMQRFKVPEKITISKNRLFNNRIKEKRES